MNTRNISWEIVFAGIAFVAIGIYLFNHNSSSSVSNQDVSSTPPSVASTPSQTPSALPNTIVIDLQNLEKLENLEQLKNIKNFEEWKKLEVELKNIGQVFEQHMNEEDIQKHLDENLKKLETELKRIENANFNVKLQDEKVYINKDYNLNDTQWTEVSPGVYVFQETFSTNGLESMDFDLGFGNINIVGSNAAKGEITLRATGNLEDPAAFSEHMNIIQKLTSPNAVFRMNSTNGSNMSNQINLEATLTLPKSTKLKAKTSGGHITLDTIEGETIAKTGGGHITCEQISGNVELSTGGGHIKVQNTNGSLTAKTGGGHIEIKNASGNIVARTSGGNITTSVQEANGPLKFYTSAGNISLMLPENIGANLDISGSAVKLADRFTFAGDKSKGSISGTLNGGGVPIVVGCEYGNVNIDANK